MPPSICTVSWANDNEHGHHTDCERWLEELAPHAPISQCRHTCRFHNRTGKACPEETRGNSADACLKRQNMAREGVAVTNGRLNFGTWERIFYGELAGWRRKRVLVKIIGE